MRRPTEQVLRAEIGGWCESAVYPNLVEIRSPVTNDRIVEQQRVVAAGVQSDCSLYCADGLKRASGREAYGRCWTAVHAQKGVAHRISVGVPDRHDVTVRCVNMNTIELESTRVVAHVHYLRPAGARRAACDPRT